MITKQDVLILLAEISNNGINVDEQMKDVLRNGSPSVENISFIMDNMGMDAQKFYEKIRKSYNDKKSHLYINIVKDNLEDPREVLTTLASLQLQILLFSKNIDNVQMFLRHMRFEEISKCMLNYSKTYDIIPCQKLLHAFKADLKVFEYIKNSNRDTKLA